MVIHALRSSWNNKTNENKEQATLICCCKKRRKISRRTQCRWIEPVNQIILIWHSWVNGVIFTLNRLCAGIWFVKIKKIPMYICKRFDAQSNACFGLLGCYIWPSLPLSLASRKIPSFGANSVQVTWR